VLPWGAMVGCGVRRGILKGCTLGGKGLAVYRDRSRAPPRRARRAPAAPVCLSTMRASEWRTALQRMARRGAAGARAKRRGGGRFTTGPRVQPRGRAAARRVATRRPAQCRLRLVTPRSARGLALPPRGWRLRHGRRPPRRHQGARERLRARCATAACHARRRDSAPPTRAMRDGCAPHAGGTPPRPRCGTPPASRATSPTAPPSRRRARHPP
jgi:hypothetical protein